MIRIQFGTILLVCTFAFSSQRGLNSLFSFDTSEETSSSGSSSGSSSSSSEEITQSKLIKDAQQLKPEQQRLLMKNFLNHLLAVSQLQTDERKLEHEMLEDLTKIPNFENDAFQAISKFRKVIEEGRKALDKIVEKRKSVINAQDPKIVQEYDGVWLQIEAKKRDEAKAALEKVDSLLSHFANSLKSTVGEQLKTLQRMQHLIGERKKIVDRDSAEVRKRIDALKAQAADPTKEGSGTTSAPQSISQVFLFDENDVKEIRQIYTVWMERLPKDDSPRSKNLIKKIEQSGLSLPLFCKSLAELHILKYKINQCEKRGDKIGKEVLSKTLDQPNYKKCIEIFESAASPPLFELGPKVVRMRIFKFH